MNELFIILTVGEDDKAMSQATFYFDLGSPFAYLAAERLPEVVGESVRWQPVSLGALFKATSRSSWALGDPERRQVGMAEVERRVRRYGLPPLRWPDPWPSNYLFAMRVATFAFELGCGREFTMAAFRRAFQHGEDLGCSEHVLGAAAEAGLDVSAALAAAGDPAVKLALRVATDAAHQRGVFGVPTVAVGDALFWGEDRLSEVALALARGA
jgi:2-hydroxychromene-2-carboxylate isomerase